MNKVLRKRKMSVFDVVLFVLLTVYSLTMIFLIVWTLLCSFKSKTDFNMHPLGWPKEFKFSNYVSVLRDLNVPLTKVGYIDYKIYLPELFLYSVIYSVGCTAVYVFARAIVAYVVARFDFKFGAFLYSLNLVVMIIPIVGRLPGELQLMRILNFYDNIWALCFMKASFTGMDFMLFHSTFASISKEYTEAARVDGASQWTIMFRIIFPMTKQIMLILALTNFIGYWNDWSATITYMPSYPTAAYALYVFQNSNLPEIALGGIPYTLSACIVVMTPVLILFFAFRKQIMGEISFGGVKG